MDCVQLLERLGRPQNGRIEEAYAVNQGVDRAKVTEHAVSDLPTGFALSGEPRNVEVLEVDRGDLCRLEPSFEKVEAFILDLHRSKSRFQVSPSFRGFAGPAERAEYRRLTASGKTDDSKLQDKRSFSIRHRTCCAQPSS